MKKFIKRSIPKCRKTQGQMILLLAPLLETPADEIDKDKLEMLLCRASIIGQEQGFVSGFRFCIRLLSESVS